jgi:8-oxo-dGTP diphosphatase
MNFQYEFPRPALTVDCVVFGFDEGDLKVLLIRRALEPFRNRWALPGGFVRISETIDDAARRELAEETGLRNIFLEQLFTFGDLDRDPRERVVSVAHFALVKLADVLARADTDATDAQWFPVATPPALGFDHSRILSTAHTRLQGKVRYQPIGFELLPEKFTLSQLQHLYEAILGTQLDKRNFRKKVLGFDFLVPLRDRTEGIGRPAQLFRFDPKNYERLRKRGIHFEL